MLKHIYLSTSKLYESNQVKYLPELWLSPSPPPPIVPLITTFGDEIVILQHHIKFSCWWSQNAYTFFAHANTYFI